MGLNFIKDADVLTVAVSGDIDHHNAKSIRESIDKKVKQEEPKLLKLDLRNLSFMDSSGIGLIMGRYKLLSSIGGDLRVVNIPPYFLKVIKISGLEQLGILERSKLR